MRSARIVRSHSIASALMAALAIASVVACAQGTNGADDDDDDVHVDARRVDARPADARTVDAPFAVDARQPDASIGLDSGLPGLDGGLGGNACTQNSECPAGECCFGGLMCVEGTPSPLPPPFDCLPG